MKKPTVILVVVVSVIAISFLGWWIYKSRNQPLTHEEIVKSLKTGELLIGEAGFILPVKNISSKRITAGIKIVPTVEQNGVSVREGYLEVTETWEPQEEKKIFIKYDVNKPMSGSRYEVSNLFSVKD